MKHHALLFFALLLSMLALGCDDGSSEDPQDTSGDQVDQGEDLGQDQPDDHEQDAEDLNQDLGEDTQGLDTGEVSIDVEEDEICVPQCDGAVCGENGCGGVCGNCDDGESCHAGQCVVSECPTGCTEACPPGCYDMGECGEYSRALELTGNLYTMGMVATIEDNPTQVYYRQEDGRTWWRAHDPVALPDGRLATSLFSLQPETTYQVLSVQGEARFCNAATTLAIVPAHQTTTTLHVSAGASGGDGSESAPFGTIQAAINQASSGTDIIIGAGLYHEEVSINTSGQEGQYVRLLGEPGAIIDGSSSAPLSWEDQGENVYRTPWEGDPRYLLRDSLRLYHYLDLAGLQAGIGDDNEIIDEGFFVEDGALYIRSLTPPGGHQWQIPDLNTALSMDGVSWIWIEGLEIRYFGEGAYAKGIDVRSSDHVVIRDNHVHDMPSPIWVRKGASFVRVEENLVHQSSVHTWPWAAVKGTDHENSAISLAGGHGAIAAKNEIYHIFNGIYTGSFGDDNNAEISYDHDVYWNRMRRVTDDGLEPEGACVNNRFWDNQVDEIHNGVSLAPITWGPVWVIGNRFTDYEQSGFKVSNDSDAPVFLYHNTCWTDRPDHNGMNVSGPFSNMVFRNNIIRGTRYAIEMSRPALPNSLDYDNLFSTRGDPLIKWDNTRYSDLAALCGATGLECSGHQEPPGLLDPGAGSFGLSEGSTNIDRGVRIEGINDDYNGEAPDIGYLELGRSEIPPLNP